MKRLAWVTFLFFILAGSIFAGGKKNILFSDNFQSYQNGSPGAPDWHITKGDWHVENGKFFQTSSDYDCGALLDFYLNESFELSFKFRVISGTPGAGFFFHSRDLNATKFSHMCRFESETTMLVGRFVNGEYESTHNVILKKQNFSRWHKIRLLVNQEKSTFSIFLDDSPLASDEPLSFTGGFCGLQSSGGEIAFDDVQLKILPMKKKIHNLSWIDRFVLAEGKKIVFPRTAQGIVDKIDFSGKVLQTIGAPEKMRGQLNKPTSIAMFANGDFVVSDSAAGKIHIFSRQGKWLRMTGGADKLAAAGDVTVDDERRIYVIDRKEAQVFVFDENLKKMTDFGKGRLENPAAIDVRDDSIFVLNNGTHRVEIFRWNSEKIENLGNFSFHAGIGKDILVDKKFIYVTADREIRLFARNGKFIKNFHGELLADFHPSGLAADRHDKIYVSDPLQGKIFIFDEDLSEISPVVEFSPNRNASIRFGSGKKQKAGIRVTQNDSVIFQKIGNEEIEHRFVLANLPTSTVYHFSISPTYPQIPKAKKWSKPFVFITPPDSGKKHFWRIPMVTIIFTNVLDTAKWKTDFPPLPDLSENEINRIKAQINDGVKFYWMNSGMNLWLDNKFIVVKKHYFRHQLFGSEWWYPPREEMVEQAIEDAGYKVEQFKSVLYLACVRDFDEEKGEYFLRGRGGGFTSGLSANGKFGLSYWEVTHANHFSGNNWLMAHEFHHQLDELFLLSGYPEYWFNHFSPTIGTAAHFGEHFDGNAWILRNWDQAKWFDLKYGEMVFADDKDMDGIPDNDPRVPVDEKRLGTSPLFRDYDHDGVADGDEIKFSNWIVEGCGETYGGAAVFPDLLSPDTDRDGIGDADDPYPLYPFPPRIFYVDSTFSADNLAAKFLFARLTDKRIHAEVFAAWDSSAVTFFFKTDRLAPVKLMLDSDADGWFLGRDNLRFYLTPENDSTLTAKIEVVNCSRPDRWPFHDTELAKKVKFEHEIQLLDNSYLIFLKIYKNEFLGLALKKGEEIGVNIGFKVMMDEKGHQRYVTIFEPNRFFDVELKNLP
ncbi:MAG: hypothetical protein GXO74_04305 [Calditrichaeota bacterium]|nr:hypothetical protein [Calditrichota bacterium]